MFHNVIVFMTCIVVIFATYSFGYASAGFKSDNTTGNLTNQTSTEPMEIIEFNSTENDINRTGLVSIGPPKVVESKPTGNYTSSINGTLISVGPPKVVESKPTRQNTPNVTTGNDIVSIPKVNITREQAAKAEQDANFMIKAYYEKLEQEKQKEREEAATLAAAAQANQTTEDTGQAEGSQEDAAAALADETDTDVEDEEDDSEDIDNEEEDDE